VTNGNWSGGKENSMDRSSIPMPRWCKSCLKAGCTACRAVEGGEDCAFCEDGELCPTRQRIAERAKAANISVAAHRTAKDKEPKQKKENVMDKKLCKCGCGEPLAEGAVREYKNGHKPKAEKKSGGASSASPSAERIVTPRSKQKAAKKKDGPQIARAFAGAAAAAFSNATATIQVTVNGAHLDDWWQGRTLAEKGEVFTNWLQVGR
jgi:hypothetical protein